MSEVIFLLRAAGLKATPARQFVLQLLRGAQQPMSHAEVLLQVERLNGVMLDRVTLYRVLDSLVGTGLALRAADARGVARFSAREALHSHDEHMHFRCTDCGGVFCLNAAPPPPPELPSGFSLEATQYDVSGVCAKCHHR